MTFENARHAKYFCFLARYWAPILSLWSITPSGST